MFSVVRFRAPSIVSGRLIARSYQSISINQPINAREINQAINHSQTVKNESNPPIQHIILTGRSSSSKRPTLDANQRLDQSIQSLLQPGYQSTSREWLNAICELSKLKQYERISSLWKQWMTTLPSSSAIKQMSKSEKNMFLPNESIFAVLLKCPAGVVNANEAVQYLDCWSMEMTGQIHRMMVNRSLQADDVQSSVDWLKDLYKRNLRSAPAIETSLFRQLMEKQAMLGDCYELVVQAWDRSVNTSAGLDASWCVAILPVLVRYNDSFRCSQMAQKFISNGIGSYSFSAPELFGPLIEFLYVSGLKDQSNELIRHWNSTAPSMNMDVVASTKQEVRSLLERDEIDLCVAFALTRNTFGQLLRSSYALLLHVLNKKNRVADMEKVWKSWLSTILPVQSIHSMTLAERNCLLPQEADLAFLLSIEPAFAQPDQLLSLSAALDLRPTALLYGAIMSHNVRCCDFSTAISYYLDATESGVAPNDQIVSAVISAVRSLLTAETRPPHLHGVVVSVWEFCMASSSPLTSEWADVFLSVFEYHGDEERAMQLIECILSAKLSDATPKLVGSFVTRLNVMLLKKGRKPLPSTLATMRIFHTHDRRAIDS